MKLFRKKFILTFMVVTMIIGETLPFCGFYVAKADANLFNKKSQVILVRDGNYTSVTMSNDFQGDVKDFAMVVPVPVVLNEHDIRTVNPNVFSKLDSYSGPRLVEYYDENPCYERIYEMEESVKSISLNDIQMVPSMRLATDKKYKVTIEAEYKVDEYDILILSAKESDGLKNWLTDNGYKIPAKAEAVLDPYIKNNLKFFVVKVNAERFKASGISTLKPIQIHYSSPKFMLPIRLGMANSTGEQDMIVYALTKQGRAEVTNYRTVKIPSNKNVPEFIQQNFGQFYVDLFEKEYKHQGRNAVFLEYAWNVTPSWGGMKCDPCVGPPPIYGDLTEAGVNWNMNNEQVFFTRLHVRYSRDKFPQDLLFQVTPNKETFQGRYIITHPANGDLTCDAGQDYLHSLVNRRQRELSEMEALSGWSAEGYPYYVKKYKNQILDKDEERGFVLPVLPHSGGGIDTGFWSKIIFSITLLISVMMFLVKFKPSKKQLA